MNQFFILQILIENISQQYFYVKHKSISESYINQSSTQLSQQLSFIYEFLIQIHYGISIFIFLSFLTINSQMTHKTRNQNTILQGSQQDKDMDTLVRGFSNYGERAPAIFSTFSLSRNNSEVPMLNTSPSLWKEPSVQFFQSNRLNNKMREEQQKEEGIRGDRAILCQQYNKESLEYTKYRFNDRIRLIIRRIGIKAYNIYKEREDHVFFTFCVQKMLSLLAKKLFLNRFELLLLEYVLEETKWKFQMEVISQRCGQFKSFMSSGQSDDQNLIFKQLQIYMLYCGYYSKKSLNQLPNQNIYNEFLKSICPSFVQCFKEWTQASNIINFKINPKVLNNIFKRLNFYSNTEKQHIDNYSVIVEEIIDISPAYNADKNKAVKQKKNKKIKPNSPIQFDMVVKSQEQSPNQLPPQYSEIEIPQYIPQNIKQASYMSNVDGFDPHAHVKNL